MIGIGMENDRFIHGRLSCVGNKLCKKTGEKRYGSV
jgi:hypothetical protein